MREPFLAITVEFDPGWESGHGLEPAKAVPWEHPAESTSVCGSDQEFHISSTTNSIPWPATGTVLLIAT